MRILSAVLAALAIAWLPAKVLAADTGYGAPVTPSPQGQTQTGNDPSNADNMGATGWSGSWTANEGQNDDAGTGTTDRAKPMPPVPPAASGPATPP